jgi:hypothetical protein
VGSTTDPRSQDPQPDRPREDRTGGAPGAAAIARKVSELAALLDESARSGPEAVERALRQALLGVDPIRLAAIQRVFGGEMRQALLKVLLFGGAEEGVPPADLVERISNDELVALVARLLRQFLSIESAVVAFATEFMHEGQKVKLPRHFANLRGYVLQLIHNGGIDSVEKVNSYLKDINQWIAASLKAWEQAPDQWWTEWWRKISPQSIEEEISVGVVGILIGNKYYHYWKRYRELAQDLNPPDAKSQILEIAGRIAKETMAL